MVCLKITSSWIRKFVDFVFVPKIKFVIFYFHHNIKFHWVANLRESFNTLDRWAVEVFYKKWKVDIKVFILTVVENSGICKFSRIYFIEFENKKKSTELTLLARTLAISFNIYIKFVFMSYKYLLLILFSIFVYHN